MRHIIDPQKWNRYAYANNNPVVFNDPDGLAEYEFRITARIESDKTYFPVPAKGGVKYQQTFRVETDAAKNASGLVSYQPYVGPSEGVGLTDEKGCFPIGWTSGQQTADGIALSKQGVTRDAEGDVVIEANAAVAYPLLPAPAIDSMYIIVLGPDGTIKYWYTSHDRFPSHSLQWRKVGDSSWQTLHYFRPRWFDTTLNLFPPFPNVTQEDGEQPKERVRHWILF